MVQHNEETSRGAGYYLKVEGEIDGQKAHVVYMHLVRDSFQVKKGDIVVAGQYIADMGNSGGSTGTHLHFEIRIFDEDGTMTKVDPMSFDYNYLDWE